MNENTAHKVILCAEHICSIAVGLILSQPSISVGAIYLGACQLSRLAPRMTDASALLRRFDCCHMLLVKVAYQRGEPSFIADKKMANCQINLKWPVFVAAPVMLISSLLPSIYIVNAIKSLSGFVIALTHTNTRTVQSHPYQGCYLIKWSLHSYSIPFIFLCFPSV